MRSECDTSNVDCHPSYIECVAQVLGASPEPMSLDAPIAQVERRRPMTKGERSAIYKAIDQLYQVVPVAPTVAVVLPAGRSDLSPHLGA